MGDQFEPSIAETGSFRRPQDVQSVTVGVQHVEIDGFENGLRGVQLEEKHGEDALVRQLVEIGAASIVVL